MTTHKYRKWGGHPFGTKAPYNVYMGRYETVEPFPGACGGCGKAKEDHVSEMTHQQKIELLRGIEKNYIEQTKQIKDLLAWLISETRKESHGN